MKPTLFSRWSLRPVDAEGAIMALAPAPFMLAGIQISSSIPPWWRLAVASAATISCLFCAFWIFSRPRTGKILGGLAAAGGFFAAFPYFAGNPFAALLGSVAVITTGFALLDFKLPQDHPTATSDITRSLHQARGAAIAVPVLVLISMIMDSSGGLFTQGTIAAAGLTGQFLFARWAWKRRTSKPASVLMLLSLLGALLIAASLYIGHTQAITLLSSVLIILLLPRAVGSQRHRERWWAFFLTHPARMLVSTFLALCLLGALLLSLPGATRPGGIGLVDAFFTSVSAVCVTGLIVLDTPHDFTFLGQAFILLLIQLGGLGIMSVTTVALHAMGRRLSLRQERLMKTMTDTDHKDLIASLATILKFTFAAEGLGALLLVFLFFLSGDTWGQALWRGLFTAISAFCNAGFALQSDSLIPYQGNPWILYTISSLIIFGGLAPATSLLFPKWLSRHQVPVPTRLAWATTAALLFAGTLFMLAFEWDGILRGMSLADKIHNAWFQSVTLRTAGFNSVDITHVVSPTFLVMLCFMFIGGSPGGTAGGVKTTTIGVLALTFWANITNRKEVIIQNRRIPSGTIYRAVTIVMSGALVWFAVVLMLEVTQQIGARDIIFEASSAIGTVGLTTGATALLDEIGKVIIMLTMFTGRIGPMTLFMLLSEDHSPPVSHCLDAKITLT